MQSIVSIVDGGFYIKSNINGLSNIAVDIHADILTSSGIGDIIENVWGTTVVPLTQGGPCVHVIVREQYHELVVSSA